MASFIKWLDHSEEDQRRVREVLALFSDKGTVDDLGLGTVRDGLSNLMFPGTSVIQTRARYYLFIPWTYRHIERRHPTNVVAKGADFERAFIGALKAGGDERGIIGRNAGQTLKTLPSSIYWNGLGRYGIFTAPGLSIANYGKRFARSGGTLDHEDELVFRSTTYWHRDLPDRPAGFHKLEPIDFTLTYDEATWLTERITSIDDGGPRSSLLTTYLRSFAFGGSAPSADHLWEAPLPANTPPRMRDLVHHAERLSCAAQGTALLYNLMLAERREPPRDDEEAKEFVTTEYYRNEFNEWATWCAQLGLGGWAKETPQLWELLRGGQVRVPERTQLFLDTWVQRLATIAPEHVAEDAAARELIESRELAHKRGQARFANKKRIQLWEGLAGTTPMAYRWPLVRTILGDIADGLNGGAVDAVA